LKPRDSFSQKRRIVRELIGDLMEDANTAKQVFIEKSKQIENAAKEKPN